MYQEQSKTQAKALRTTPPCRPGRYINRESCISTAIKTEARALLVVTAVSTWAVYQPQSAKRKHLWRCCISPARYSCMSTAIKKTEGKALLDDTAVSTRAVCPPRELYINSNQKLKRKHFWTTRPCRPGRFINRDQRIKSLFGAAVYNQRNSINCDQSEIISGAAAYHQHGLSTAISERKA